ncbi:glycosyl transferase family 1 [Azospirillum baldaniorum]|uniref:Glycosyl transferase, group 1 n=1 Tax=Azospirillum baldaniorum TaxID=1064539 RepID=A0A9P1JNV0_9PROT|nr:glycosyltransferase [Azospirillum baldaniorum]TWA79012.1 glycosyltransferase involved in cell wall biosynthesis [Azospirillum brasilense]AWJ90781.1 glycosyl transferase family 1 [Azospirillum baldaniorum]NUB10719.1 glycosyltransferase [Azospirillum baldaniorum]TWA69599.1 glycosyltransferase involved in cell wall biosynthesis [Azospirillum baldaniorum]CCC96985.1 putative Glycosyl transferase, group 1 [Azospirillum baldaniorum]
MTKPALVFSWEMFGPYHMDRLEAVGRRLGHLYDVVGLEVGSKSHTYAWDSTGEGQHFRKVTLFPGRSKADIPSFQVYRALLRECRKAGASHVFLCHYEEPDVFALAVTMRLMGRRVVNMNASKFDDKPRVLWREALKSLLYKPYQAAIGGSHRTVDYYRFLGLPKDRLFIGYDTLSLERVRRLSGMTPAPDGVPFAERHFTIIARFVPKKNLFRAVEAYDLYRRLAGDAARPLHLCGSGPLEADLRAEVAKRGLEGHIIFRGFLQEKGIAETLGSTLCLLLPSLEEQFGLVVNEALAMGVPTILSDQCGARDVLIRSGLNGHIVEPDNPEGLARHMLSVASDEAEWRRLSLNGRPFQALADAGYFAEAVEKALHSLGARKDADQGAAQSTDESARKGTRESEA